MSITVAVDWNRDGTFTTFGHDVSTYVRARTSPIFCEYGRDQSTALSPTVAGRGSVTLDNSTKRFSPRNTASPLYGTLKPARPVLITRTIGATTYTLFAGHTDYSPINPDLDSRTVSLSLIDWLGDFRGQTITTELYKGIRTGEAIGYVLDAVGWTGTRDLDTGTAVLPWWWENGTDAFDALEKIIQTEGPPALLTVGADGGIVFRDRHHRIIRSASTTVQSTWRANPDAAQPIMQRPFSYDEAWTNIVNSATATADVRLAVPESVVWSSDVIFDLGANEVRTIIMTTDEPFYDIQPPRAGTDFTLVSGSVSQVQLLPTSGAMSTVYITAGAGGAKIDKLQVRATSVPVAYTVQVTATDATSVTDYGKRGLPNDLPWCSPSDAQAVVDSVVQQYKQPNPVLSVRFVIGNDATKAAALLTRNLSDRVRVIEAETALDNEFYIESIRHELSGPEDHAIIFGLEMCPTVLPSGADVFLFGGSSGHRFNEGKFAS